jgi:hypothetical protein
VLLIDVLLDHFHCAQRPPHSGSSVVRRFLHLKVYCFLHAPDIVLEFTYLRCHGRRGLHDEVKLADSANLLEFGAIVT